MTGFPTIYLDVSIMFHILAILEKANISDLPTYRWICPTQSWIAYITTALVGCTLVNTYGCITAATASPTAVGPKSTALRENPSTASCVNNLKVGIGTIKVRVD
jgi:hypothetical protein